MEWTVVTVLIAIAGLAVTVGRPILKLNQNITTLNVTLKYIDERVTKHDKALDDQAKHARESHKKLWDHNEEQDRKLEDHEKRLYHLEQNKEE